ncbi:patatin-like phospholipase family protein [Roseovarius tibetensis]|uniref:patatin-like phospholipase family protein n=1 Tax=Roseovarius tibetensis TaxID=2685897 RepID=UPI003D7F2210
MTNTVQKRLLAIDGGGILGLISLGMLAEVEAQLRDAHGGDPKFRLRDYFDYIGGTSTGAVIAAGLAIGKSVAELRRLYVESGARMFDKAALVRRWRYSYEADNLRAMLRREFGDGSILDLQRAGTLLPDRHLLVVTRNANTDSPWPVSTNPTAKYNDIGRGDCNLLLPLWQLVRASTAAPTFFAPERLDLAEGRSFYFEDGGVTAYNNPAFLLFRMATEPAYRCGWPTGEDRLMLVSVGTGMSYRTLDDHNPRGEGLLTSASTIVGEVMRSIAVEQDIACRTLGRCVHGSPLDREIGDLILPHDPKRPKSFLYARYDVDVSQEGLNAAGLADIPADVLVMDNAAMIPELEQIGDCAGKQVAMARHFGAFLP